MKKIFSAVLAVALSFCFANVALAETKIGVIDLQKVMQKSSQVAAINAQLEKDFKPRQEKLVGMQKDLQAEMDKLNREGAVMSPSDRTKLQNKVAGDRANFQKMADSFQQELSTAQNQAMQKFMQKVVDAIKAVSANGKYDMVLLKAAVPYMDPKFDVTDEVIKQIK